MASVPQPGSRAPIYWGLVLIVGGFVLLALSLGMLPVPGGDAVGVLLALLGVALLASFVLLRTHWWTLLAGPVSLGFATAILLPDAWAGPMFLALMGSGFALVAVTRLERWWAIIPAGCLLTLALIAALSSTISGVLAGTLLFAGLAATFGVLAVIRVRGHTMRWPIYPALGCLAFALLVASDQLGAILWPVVLIAAGGLLLLRATTMRRGS